MNFLQDPEPENKLIVIDATNLQGNMMPKSNFEMPNFLNTVENNSMEENIDNLNFMNQQILMKKIQEQLKSNQDNMMGELRDLNIIKDQNSFLHDVYDDYRTYHHEMVNQKKDFKIQLQNIARYLEKNYAKK